MRALVGLPGSWLALGALLALTGPGVWGRSVVRRWDRDRSRDLGMDIQGEDLDQDLDLAGQPYMEVTMTPVPVQYFALKLSEAHTYHDVLRIFYGEILTNNVIDNMLREQPYKKQRRQEGVAMGRPRIGGVSDTMTMARRTPRLDGIVMSPFMLDSPDDSAEPTSDVSACPDCDKNTRTLFTDTAQHSRHQRHRDRPRKEKGKAHSGTGRRQTPPVSNTEDLEKALNHTKEMLELTRCQQPVPVVVRIRDISTSANKEYFPKCTIVHHCRADAGCCDESATCASKTNVTITRQFFAVEYKTPGKAVGMAPELVETFTFINHTECECKPVQQLPRCLDCPFPFHLRRENHTDCACDCFDRDRTCIRIKKGKSALHEDQLRCIKEHHCHRPKCQYGVFNEKSIKTGYCPRGGRSRSSSREGHPHTTPRSPHRRRSRWR